MDRSDEEPVELECPVCGARFEAPRDDVERTGLATCPRGHEVPVARAL